jgi:hypothetical protein
VFNGSGDRQAVEIIDISDPTQPATVGGIDVNAYGDEPQAVAIHKGILAVRWSPMTVRRSPAPSCSSTSTASRLADRVPLLAGRGPHHRHRARRQRRPVHD